MRRRMSLAAVSGRVWLLKTFRIVCGVNNKKRFHVRRVKDAMSEFERICSRGELPNEGEAKEFASADGRALCVARVNGEVTAMDNECPHNGGPLAEGMIEEGKIICPWHAWAFDRHTGEAEHSSVSKVAVYQIRVEGDDVLVKV